MGLSTNWRIPKQIPEPALGILRLIWLLIGLTAIALTLIGIIELNRTFQLPCDLQGTDLSYCLSREEGLTALGLSWPFFANWLTIGVVIEFFPWFIAGFLIFWQRSDSWFGLLSSLWMMLAGISAIDPNIQSWTQFAYPATEWMIQVISFLGVSLGIIWFYFPDGKLTFRWTRWFFVFWVLRNIGIWFFPGTIIDTNVLPFWIHKGLEYSFPITFGLVLLYRYRRKAGAEERQQIKWVVAAAIVLLTLYILQELVFLQLETGIQTIIGNLTITSIYYLASAAFAGSIVVAIFRYRLFDIDVIIRRTLSYALLSTMLVLIYFGGVVLLQGVFGSLAGRPDSPLIIVLSTLTIAALFNPLRTRSQAFIDRRFFRQKYDAEQTLAAFAAAARDEVDPDRLTGSLIRVVEETMQPEETSLWLKK